MKQRVATLKTLKHFKPSIVLLAIAMVALVFTNAHIIVPIVLIIGAIVIAWENYKIIKAKKEREQEREQEKDEVQVMD